MNITPHDIKELRNETGVSVMQCKKALEEAGGDKEKARIVLQKRGSEAAAKKSERTLGAGTVGAYVHATGAVAALVHLACETDFVGKNDEFTSLARDIAMQVAAQNPTYISRAEIDEHSVGKAKEVLAAEVADKPQELQEKILEGKLDAYFKDMVLLEQPFIKDQSMTVGALITAAVQKFGERIEVARMARVSVQ